MRAQQPFWRAVRRFRRRVVLGTREPRARRAPVTPAARGNSCCAARMSRAASGPSRPRKPWSKACMLAQYGGGFRIGHVEGARARTGFEQILVALEAGMDAGVDLGRPASPSVILGRTRG